MSFVIWFEELILIAKGDSSGYIVDVDDPESYREYYDDGDTPEQAFVTELNSHRKYYYGIKDDDAVKKLYH
jgi:hypothetical protein